ncbi:hypothetical protein EXIGLDRAFT_730091 [Exidia glandulosa HHB12029]|uniref:Uncharacterized protein n=1 Tax=Exidia glandulosa HHB12029 TaxID=1314781 RepID=A0A165LD41_EXIGL|nr:hypothetical protein EXIGLDRAFT_730091 [Exidia glandulosa HHB12029]
MPSEGMKSVGSNALQVAGSAMSSLCHTCAFVYAIVRVPFSPPCSSSTFGTHLLDPWTKYGQKRLCSCAAGSSAWIRLAALNRRQLWTSPPNIRAELAPLEEDTGWSAHARMRVLCSLWVSCHVRGRLTAACASSEVPGHRTKQTAEQDEQEITSLTRMTANCDCHAALINQLCNARGR